MNSSVVHHSAEDLKGSVDFALIAIREDEFAAVLHFFPPTAVASGRQRTYEISDFKTADGSCYRAALLRTLEQGHSAAQAAASDVISDLNPSWIVLVGIAGAVPETEFSLGDVVVATRMIDFSISAALADGTTETAHRGAPAHKAIQNFISRLPALQLSLGGWNKPEKLGVLMPSVLIDDSHLIVEDLGWKEKIRNTLEHRFQPKDGSPLRLPIVTAAAIASGNTLMKDPKLIQEWLRNARELKAVEMELPGVFEAARSISGDVPVLAVRGISDIVGFKRDPAWTGFACKTAASLARALLDLKPIVPSDKQLPSKKNTNVAQLPTIHSNIVTGVQVIGGNYNHTENYKEKSIHIYAPTVYQEDSVLKKLLKEHEAEKLSDPSYKIFSEELNKFFCKAIHNNSRELDRKLIDGNRDYLIEAAMDSKEIVAKKILRLSHFNSAQEIYTYLLTNIRIAFLHEVKSKIKSQSYMVHQIDDIVSTKIIDPLLQNLHGSSLGIDRNELYGLLYFLTGNCHIDWD